jgi:DNA-binding Lrp family transcriptional regulator
MYKLDMKDKKLLYELDLNSRQSLSNLAKKLNLSKSSVIYRINNLQKEGIIKQFHTELDVGKLGYIGFRLYFKVTNATPEKKGEIIGYLKSKKIVTWIVSIDGPYSIGCLVLAKTIKEMNDLWKEFFSTYVNYIDDYLLTIMTKVRYFSRAYLMDLPENTYESVFVTEPSEMKLDETDMEILKLMAPDARIQIVDIAQKLKLTSNTVISRIKHLEKKGVIVGYKTVFDLEKLGYQYFKLHFAMHNMTKEREKLFRNYVKVHPNIIYDDEVLGGDYFEIEVQFKELAELRRLIEDIESRFADIIKSYKTMQFYKEHKYLFLPV